MEKVNRPEKEEGVILSIARGPSEHYGFIIAIRGSKTKEEAFAYNRAAETVLKAEGLSPFHELSTGGEHDPGMHLWEIPKSVEKTVTKEMLEGLLSRIEEEAKIIMKKRR